MRGDPQRLFGRICREGAVLPHVRVNRIELHYEEEGAGQPVLFIHGGFGGVESTLYPKPSVVAGALPANAFRTISFDRRNSGRSQFDTSDTRLEDLAADARALLEALGIEHAIVVGDSLGGMIAQRFALDYADVTSGLVLLETSAHILRRTRRVRAVLLAMRLLGPRVLYRMFRRRFLEPDWSKPIGPDPSEAAVQLAREQSLEFRRSLRELSDADLYRYSLGLIRTYVAFSGCDLRREIGRLRMPVEVIHGSADRIVGAHHGRELSGLIPQANLTELAGLGHGLLYYREGREALGAAVEVMAGLCTAGGLAKGP
jgi:pimeloyl-ACP methyl ester carboxylesterase